MKSMLQKSLFATGVAALTGGLALAPAAHATVYTLNLTGTVADTAYNTFMANGTTYQTGSLDLGLGAYAPITLDNGDELQVTISLDGAFTVPGTVDGYQFLGINFNDLPANTGPTVLPSPPAPEVSTGTMTFSGGAGAPSGAVGTNCGNCVTNLYGASGPVSSFSFTEDFGDNTIQSLVTPYTFNDVSLSYQVNGSVPEPASWALMILGMGGLGAVARRRARVQNPA